MSIPQTVQVTPEQPAIQVTPRQPDTAKRHMFTPDTAEGEVAVAATAEAVEADTS